MFGRCALRLRECIHLARKRGVLSRSSAAGSGPLVARHRQVHASCEAETGNGHKCRGAKQAHRYGVLGYKGARRKRVTMVAKMFSNRLRTVPEGASAVHGALALSNGKTRVSRPAEFPHGEKNWSRSLLRATTQCSKPVDDKSGPGGLCPGRFPASLIYVLFVGPSPAVPPNCPRSGQYSGARGCFPYSW